MSVCPYCDGIGHIFQGLITEHMQKCVCRLKSPHFHHGGCQSCGGAGLLSDRRCPTCAGIGRLIIKGCK